MATGCLPLLLIWTAGVSAEGKPADERKHAAQGYFEAAMVAYDGGDLLAAEEGLLRAYKLLPSPELAFNLARVCERLGKADQAQHWFKRYIESGSANPHELQDAQRRVALARARIVQQRAQLRLLPASGDAVAAEARQFFERGARLYARKQYGAAQVAFAAALKLSAAPELHYNLALAAERLGRRNDAVTHLREYLRAQPSAEDRPAIEQWIAQLRGATADH